MGKIYGLNLLLILFVMGTSVNAEHSDGYKEIAYQGIRYRIFITKPSRVQLFWKNPKTNKPFKRFSNVQRFLEKENSEIALIMNGGIYEPNYTPTGLHIEKGKTIHSINSKGGYGNFFLKPNGIFFITKDNKANVMETKRYIRSEISPKYALQSGPLLLNNGSIHPKFNKHSKHHLHRNGVGVDKEGNVIFVISETHQKKMPSLYEFAQLFKYLNCSHALFLDGDISKMIVNPQNRINHPNNFGCIIVVEKEKSL